MRPRTGTGSSDDGDCQSPPGMPDSSRIEKNGKQSVQGNFPRPGLLDRSDRWADTALFGSYSPRNGPCSHAEQASQFCDPDAADSITGLPECCVKQMEPRRVIRIVK